VLAVLGVHQSDADLARVQVECQPLGLISALRLALIGGVSGGTKVSGSDDKPSERQHDGRSPAGSARPDDRGVR